MKKGPNVITQSETQAPEEIEVHKHRRDISALSSATGETGLTIGARLNVTTVKLIPEKNKHIKY